MMKYYGVWVNISDDVNFGTKLCDSVEAVEKALRQKGGSVCDGDNPLIFDTQGKLVKALELDEEDEDYDEEDEE